ncbi:MAG TPA: hypothetical protein QGF05_12330 [Dehalococcoidia bacterium]|nr:hypothetical protein [Dehalococcoidia bacterium]
MTVADEAGAPVWSPDEISMDRVTRTGLGFLDIEPQAGATATRWQGVHIGPGLGPSSPSAE